MLRQAKESLQVTTVKFMIKLNTRITLKVKTDFYDIEDEYKLSNNWIPIKFSRSLSLQ